MLRAYERHLMLRYLANATEGLHHEDRATARLIESLVNPRDYLTVASKSLLSRLEQAGVEPDRDMSACQLDCLRQALRDEYAQTMGAEYDLTARRLWRLAETTGLDRTDVDILELVLRYRTQSVFEAMIDSVFSSTSGFARLATRTFENSKAPALLGISAEMIRSRLTDAAPLVASGLIAFDPHGDVTIIDRLHRLVLVPGSEDLDVNRLLLDAAPASGLDWSDFDHVAEGRDHIERLIQGALRSGASGVNILIHGPSGIGKTELCKALADRLGVTLYSVAEANDDGGDTSYWRRLEELRLAQRLLARDRGSLLLFDEMEDLLSASTLNVTLFGQSSFGRAQSAGSKVFMNRLLERTPTPTLWTMSDARTVNPALLGRMMFALELRPLAPEARGRIWVRQLELHGIEAEPHEAETLAKEFTATPGAAASVTAGTRLSGGDIAAVRLGVHGLSRVLSCEMLPQGTSPLFDPTLINADIDPVALVDSLALGHERHVSLCLKGPPGTGKSAFVRCLAERMGLEVIQKRGSDLLSMWVSGTEQNIAAAFAEARDAGAFLVFDEAESLLAERRLAEKSWEVSHVNEMLTWMESHPLPFACTTNFAERLDAATLRRFVFKITLDYLSVQLARAAFQIYFDLAPPESIAALTALTPGDFAVVRRKAAILDQLAEPTALADMLRAECDAKLDRPRPIGFRAP